MQTNLDFEKLISVIKELVDHHFPLIKQSRKQFKYSYKPWITKEILTSIIKTSIKTQNKLYRKYLKNKSETKFKTYKICRNKLTHLKELSKSSYYHRRLKESGSTSDTWKTIDDILRKTCKTTSLPSYVKYEGKRIYGHKAISNAMNNHFCNIGLKLSKISANSLHHRHQRSDKKIFDQRVLSSIFLDPTDEYEMNVIIDNLNAMKPPGFVSIPTRLI